MTVDIQVTYKGKAYKFAFGSEAYIFHTALYNEMDVKYGEDILLEFVNLVQECYLDDDNRTPLGSLADFIAENWEDVKDLSRRRILDMFYEE